MALSFLPLSHGFERLVAFLYLANGVTTIFAESLETIRRDIVTVRPTIVTGVPRVYEKIQANILAGGAALGEPRRTLFGWGVRVGLARARKASRRSVLVRSCCSNPRSRIGSYSRQSVTRLADACACWSRAARRCPRASANSSPPSVCLSSKDTGSPRPLRSSP